MSPIIPSHLQKIIPYEPGKPVEELQRELGLGDVVKLASNESPLGPPEASLEALRRALSEINRYPDDNYFYLKRKISEKFDIPVENITIGAGSAEIIVNSARSLLGPDDYAVISEQTFIMYWLAVQSVNGNLIRVPLKNYTYDLEAMAAAIDERVRIVYIANPNNPTGTMVTTDELDRFISALPPKVVLVYDEAYRHYISRPDYPDPIKYYRRGDKIIILRTFSKIYGLAGLRVGYAIALHCQHFRRGGLRGGPRRRRPRQARGRAQRRGHGIPGGGAGQAGAERHTISGQFHPRRLRPRHLGAERQTDG